MTLQFRYFTPFYVDDISIPNLSDHSVFFFSSFYFLILLHFDHVPNIQCII